MIKKIKEFLFYNKTTTQTVAKNTFWLFSGQVVGKILRASLVIFAARMLGPASWGAFSYVMSLAAFMLILADVGMTAITTRESSKDFEHSKKYFSTAFFIKIVLLMAGAAIIIWIAPHFTTIEEAKILLPLVAAMLIFDSLRNFGFSISRAMEKMQWEAGNEILTNIAITALGFYFLFLSRTSYNLTIAYMAGTASGFLLTLYLLRHYFKTLADYFDPRLIKPILFASIPFALASFLGAIMINTDLLMISWLRAPEELGFYSAAQKPVQLLYVMAGLFATALFPVLAKTALDKEKFKIILEKALRVSLAAAIPLAVGGLLLGNQIIGLLFGKIYEPATATFQILIFTLVIIFPSVIISNSLLAHGLQKKFITFSALGALGNVFFNFLLIPIWGIAGAAISTICTQLIANGFIWWKMKTVSDFKISDKIGKIIIASALMALVISALKYADVNIFINIALAVVSYFVFLKIQKEELLNYLR